MESFVMKENFKELLFWGVLITLIFSAILINKFSSGIYLTVLGFYALFITSYSMLKVYLGNYYKPCKTDASYTPSISVIIPAYNEEDCIEKTVETWLKQDYPNFEVIAINDGSTDSTSDVLSDLEKRLDDSKLTVLSYKENKGKRNAQKLGFESASGEIIVNSDSDSYPTKPDSLFEIVQPFKNPKVGGVCGNTEVANPVNWLSKSQKIRYYLSFERLKKVEALFGNVLCLSGCFSAIRSVALHQVIDFWFNQTFLGTRTSYGEDRSLTTQLIKKGWKTAYVSSAKAETEVPTKFKKYWKQQVRWTKSFIRESLIGAKFMWRLPSTAVMFYTGIFVTFASVSVILYSVWILPFLSLGRVLPYMFLLGVTAISTIYAIVYRMFNNDNYWIVSPFFGFVCVFVLMWRVPYALLSLRDTRWGTR
jgi:hyaluronan synthase